MSIVGYGNMFTEYNDETYTVMKESVEYMLKRGVNFFDTAEVYASG